MINNWWGAFIKLMGNLKNSIFVICRRGTWPMITTSFLQLNLNNASNKKSHTFSTSHPWMGIWTDKKYSNTYYLLFPLSYLLWHTPMYMTKLTLYPNVSNKDPCMTPHETSIYFLYQLQNFSTNQFLHIWGDNYLSIYYHKITTK